MSFDIRLPNITASTPEEQITQIRSYLHQFAEQLNWALTSIETGAGGYVAYQSKNTGSSGRSAEEVEDALKNFSNLKSLIIKSADIVTAYYEEFKKKFDGLYVAESDFGKYTQETSNTINVNSTNITTLFTNFQTIEGDVKKLKETLDVDAYIRTGYLYEENGMPVYGVEVGQTVEYEGEKIFKKFARFTSAKLAFYDNNNTEVAYISDRRLYISNVEVTVSYKIGGFKDTVRSDKSVVTKYEG